MNGVWLWAAVLLTALASYLSVGFVRRFALRRNLLDVPNERSSHSTPTPRGGGVAIVVSFSLAVCVLFGRGLLGYAYTALLVAATLIALVGYIDDRHHLNARVRLVVHLALASGFIAIVGSLPDAQVDRWGMQALWLRTLFTLMVIIWGTNLFNFMDGIDGIAASETIFVMLAAALLNWNDGGGTDLSVVMLLLAGAAAGFLVWNWPPARIFMGDVGSGYLGFLTTAMAVLSSHDGRLAVEVWPILGGVFIVDATTTLIRRVLRGESWQVPHRTHAYQHLARAWSSHRFVNLAVAAVNVCWLAPWAYAADVAVRRSPLYVVGALGPLALLALWCGAGRPESPRGDAETAAK